MTDQKSYVSNKKVLSVSQKHYLNLLVYKFGGEGGIRTHGTVAGTLVFKHSRFLVIPIDLVWSDERKRPIVDQFKLITMCSFTLNIFLLLKMMSFYKLKI